MSIAGVALTLGLAGCSNSETTEAAADGSATTEGQNIELLNVSYDVARDFYKDYNPLFVEHYKAEHPDSKILIKQSHGGSSKQALSVANGLQADVATMNQGSDIELLEKKAWLSQIGKANSLITQCRLPVRSYFWYVKTIQKISKTGKI